MGYYDFKIPNKGFSVWDDTDKYCIPDNYKKEPTIKDLSVDDKQTDEKKDYAGWDDNDIDKYCIPDNCKYNEVNHPKHYTSGKVECIDAIESALGIEGAKNFCQGNAIKYLFRMQHKGATTQDCEKAIWYCNKWIELNNKQQQ